MASTTCTRAVYSLLSSIRDPRLLQDVGLPCSSVSLPQAALAVYMHPPLHLAETLLVSHEWVGQIQFISPNPEKHVFLIPPGALDEITMFTVTSEAIGLRVLLSVVSAIMGDVRILTPDTVDPHFAKWIIKERGIISTWSSSCRLTPMDPVR